MKGILKHDIEAGILLEYKRFLIGFLLFTVLAICAVLKANMSSISWIECLAIMNKGALPFINTRNSLAIFDIPIGWFIIQIYISYVIGVYPNHDLKQYGINLLVRTKSREKWYIGKVVWGLISIIIIYLLEFGAVAMVVMINGNTNFLLVNESINDKVEFGLFELTGSAQILLVIVMPILTSLVACFVELFIVTLKNELVAYGSILFLCVAGTYYNCIAFWMPNSMLLRSGMLYNLGSVWKVFVFGVFVAIVFLIAGIQTFKRKDIFG
ncbi:MAG: hypothetical protein UIC64_01040 [Agathobacter sp.]|nr:hypothetical protein [Agathobacter sp.]